MANPKLSSFEERVPRLAISVDDHMGVTNGLEKGSSSWRIHVDNDNSLGQ